MTKPIRAFATLVALVLSAGLTACTVGPVIQGGPPLRLSPELMAGARVNPILISSGWTDGDEDFASTFTDEVGEELARCATGSRALELRIHLIEYDREARLVTLLNGGGAHYIGGTAEFVDPATRAVVGRYQVRAAVQAGGRGVGGTTRALLADRDMVASEEFGRALCLEAFGRNPRPPAILNATPG